MAAIELEAGGILSPDAANDPKLSSPLPKRTAAVLEN